VIKVQNVDLQKF